MSNLWSDNTKFGTWLKVEVLACEAMAELGEIPLDALADIREKTQFDKDRILEIERTVKHDVIAFLTNVAEHVGPSSRYIHLGMTSSDLLDTSLSSTLRQAGFLLLAGLRKLRSAVARRAMEYKDTPCIGRSHGVHAEPTTFGLKLAVWYDEIGRGEQRLRHAIDSISVGKVSGAVGTFAHIDPSVETYVCEKLGLKPAPVSTQIVQRDRHAEYLSSLALVAASLEKFATEVRSLQKTEVLEAEEPFEKGQKGSSAMPHKRNPVTCEQVCGLARVVKSNVQAALDNVALWHERDITHSSVERIIIPDSTIALDYILAKFTDVVDGLVVYPDNMMANLRKTRGLIFSQPLLLALTRKGVTREVAYKLVQACAMKVWDTNEDFENVAQSDAGMNEHLTASEVNACFDLNRQLRNVGFIFDRVGLKN